jgi:hypothetical protein
LSANQEILDILFNNRHIPRVEQVVEFSIIGLIQLRKLVSLPCLLSTGCMRGSAVKVVAVDPLSLLDEPRGCVSAVGVFQFLNKGIAEIV